MKSAAEPPCDDDAVKVKTGRDWAEWCAFLDEAGGIRLSHRDLAGFINSHHHAGDWWSQTVQTVAVG